MNQKGFTLIELLVVIAIIAMLLSIIMPSLNKAKRFAEEVVCKSNLHQYQIATEVYTNENNDRMPNPWESLYSQQMFTGEANRYCRWHNPDFNLDAHGDDVDSSTGKTYAGPFWPYLASTKASVCPTFRKLAARYGQGHPNGCIGGAFEPQFSYSMNRIFAGPEPAVKVEVVKKSQVRSPSQTFVWAEENMWTLTGLSGYVLNDNVLAAWKGSAVDCFGSFHRIGTGRLNKQIQDKRYESDTGASNIVMADGSLVTATPEETGDYVGSTR